MSWILCNRPAYCEIVPFHEIDTYDELTLVPIIRPSAKQVISDHFIGYRAEIPILTLAALYFGLFAYGPNPFVIA